MVWRRVGVGVCDRGEGRRAGEGGQLLLVSRCLDVRPVCVLANVSGAVRPPSVVAGRTGLVVRQPSVVAGRTGVVAL